MDPGGENMKCGTEASAKEYMLMRSSPTLDEDRWPKKRTDDERC
jgi:hypothetical protein